MRDDLGRHGNIDVGRTCFPVRDLGDMGNKFLLARQRGKTELDLRSEHVVGGTRLDDPADIGKLAPDAR